MTRDDWQAKCQLLSECVISGVYGVGKLQWGWMMVSVLGIGIVPLGFSHNFPAVTLWRSEKLVWVWSSPVYLCQLHSGVLAKPLFFGSPQQGASWMSQTQSPSSLRSSFRKEAQEETDTILKQEDHSIYSIVVRIKWDVYRALLCAQCWFKYTLNYYYYCYLLWMIIMHWT